MGGSKAVAGIAATLATMVAWVMPVHAAEIGAGVAEGTMLYNYPGDLINQCDPITWSLSAWTSAANALTVSNEVAGTGGITGSGSTACYRDGSDSGPVTLSTWFDGPSGGHFTCDSMSGTYARIGETLSMVVVGTCAINNQSIPGVTMSLSAATSGGDNGLSFLAFAGTLQFSD